MLKYLIIAILLPISLSAGSNDETLKYIIADYQDQCVKAQEDFRDIDYKEGDPVVAELELLEDNIYEIIIDKGGKTATVLHADFTCTNIGHSWCGSGGCDTYVIVDGVSYISWGWKPVSVKMGDSYLVVIPKNGGACNNSLEIGLTNLNPCYAVAAWDSFLQTFNSVFSGEYVLRISEFEP